MTNSSKSFTKFMAASAVLHHGIFISTNRCAEQTNQIANKPQAIHLYKFNE